jgi:hypothetical protein
MLDTFEGLNLRQTAHELSKEFAGTEPELDDDIYVFTFSDEGVDTMVFVGEGGDEFQYVVIFVSGDGDNSSVKEILDSVE